jgi:hypothetical protein
MFDFGEGATDSFLEIKDWFVLTRDTGANTVQFKTGTSASAGLVFSGGAV